MTQTFEEFLEEKFIGKNEIGGMPITKDNCEDLFTSWEEQLDVQELIDFADEYGRSMEEEGFARARKIALEVVEELATK